LLVDRSKGNPLLDLQAKVMMKKNTARKKRALKTEKSQAGDGSRGRVRPKKGASAAKHAHLAPDVDLDVIQEHMLPAIAAATGVGDVALLKVFLQDALSSGIPLENLEEVILQCYLFAGFPAALEGFMVLREVCDTPVKGRIKAAKPSFDLFISRGEELCKRVYGPKYKPLKQRSLDLHPDLWHWMILEGYGKVLSRPPLTPAQRELCIVSCLVVTRWTRQLRSHIHGALNVGCSPESVIGAVTTAGYVAGPWPLEWGLGIAREEIAKAAIGAEHSTSTARQGTSDSLTGAEKQQRRDSRTRRETTASRKTASRKRRPVSKARSETSRPRKTSARKRRS
jgi:4-carboxymuconolactone decarboxylase